MDKFNLIKKEIERLNKKSTIKFEDVHSKSTLQLVLRLKPSADEALQIAALGHDIDRSVEERRTKGKFADYSAYKKQHALTSSVIIGELLKKYDFDKKTISKVKYLVKNHEAGKKGDAKILTEADSLSFFEHNINNYLEKHTVEQLEDKIKFMYCRLDKKAKQIAKKMKIKNKEIDKIFHDTISRIN